MTGTPRIGRKSPVQTVLEALQREPNADRNLRLAVALFKALGATAGETEVIIARRVIANAVQGGWRKSELVMTLADWRHEIERTFATTLGELPPAVKAELQRLPGRLLA